MNNNWYVKIEEREFHGKPEGKWIVSGWYQDEKEDYDAAKIAGEKKQQEGARDNRPEITLAELAEGDDILDIVDDYFSWNVMTPHWYLHKNGTWHKLLATCKKGDFPFKLGLMSGEYGTKELAEETLKNSPKPDRFENYQEHLQAADDPISCK